MLNISNKVDGVSTLPAAEFNSIVNELKNFITSAGITLSGSDANQIAKSIAIYASGSDFYTDSGTANAYILTVVGAKLVPTSYFNGMKVRFQVGNTNTGSSTVNVASLGVKNIKKDNGTNDLDAGDLVSDTIVELTYRTSSGGFFELTNTQIVAADFIKKDTTANTTVGYTTTSHALGNSGTGTVTPTISTGSIKTLTINGSFTLSAPTDAESGYILIEATNNATGGYGVTISAYDSVGGTYDPTANAVNLFVISKVGSNSYLQIIQPV